MTITIYGINQKCSFLTYKIVVLPRIVWVCNPLRPPCLVPRDAHLPCAPRNITPARGSLLQIAAFFIIEGSCEFFCLKFAYCLQAYPFCTYLMGIGMLDGIHVNEVFCFLALLFHRGFHYVYATLADHFLPKLLRLSLHELVVVRQRIAEQFILTFVCANDSAKYLIKSSNFHHKQ